jgi:hypothetical protein
MIKEEWIEIARKNRKKLENLVANYHPVRARPNPMRITAPNAERACEIVRRNIRENFEGDPITQLNEALNIGDVTKINKLLNDAWFGVPESTDCWDIEGFAEAVDLMDDLPYD